jgi:hypothetical protein
MDLLLTPYVFSIGLIIFAAYIVFGIAGFGTALIASPVLIHFIPLVEIIPLLALLDMLAAIKGVRRDYPSANTHELTRLIPLMIVGSTGGALILLYARPEVLMLALGLFAIAYVLISLVSGRFNGPFPEAYRTPFGLVGGVFSALFGSGGFIYAIYLTGRLKSADAIRVTQTTLIGFSTLTRVVLFVIAGVYTNTDILLMALVLLPIMYLGTSVGRWISQRLSNTQFKNAIKIFILISGALLIGKYVLG